MQLKETLHQTKAKMQIKAELMKSSSGKKVITGVAFSEYVEGTVYFVYCIGLTSENDYILFVE